MRRTKTARTFKK